MVFIFLSCAEPEQASLAPDTHTWKDEGELVVSGLEEVERLWTAGNKDAARVLAERVYTERWEPRLEQAAKKMDGKPAIEMEYAFAVLMVELEGNGRNLEGQVRAIQDATREIASAATDTFPPPASSGLPAPPPKAHEGSHPIVPDVEPNWEKGGG